MRDNGYARLQPLLFDELRRYWAKHHRAPGITWLARRLHRDTNSIGCALDRLAERGLVTREGRLRRLARPVESFAAQQRDCTAGSLRTAYETVLLGWAERLRRAA